MITGDQGPKGDKGDDDCCACPKWGPWTPDPSTVCLGQTFQQIRIDTCTNGGYGGYGGSVQYQNETGTATPNWGPWTPDPSTVCLGQTFQQIRTDLNGNCGNDYQNETGTKCCADMNDSVSIYDYHLWNECPGAGSPCPSGTGISTCSNATGSGYVTSKQFLKSCVIGLTPKANVSASFDNTGSLGSLSDDGSTRPECSLGSVSGTINPQVIDEGDYIRLKIDYTYKNASHGGPYGISGSAYFYFV